MNFARTMGDDYATVLALVSLDRALAKLQPGQQAIGPAGRSRLAVETEDWMGAQAGVAEQHAGGLGQPASSE